MTRAAAMGASKAGPARGEKPSGRQGRRRRIVAAAMGAMLLLGAGPAPADEDERRERQEPPHYESPILSLLFLPANILIRMASVFAPKQPPSDAPERAPHRSDR